MSAYVALLRGINVGGHHKVPMADLRALCETLGLTDVSTYIQSGNIVFASEATEADLTRELSEAITDRFGFEIPVVVRGAAELTTAAEAAPLAHLDVEEKLLHVAFLTASPSSEAVRAFDLTRYAPDMVVVRGRDAYVAYPNGSGRSKLTLDVIERALGGPATARNWRTVQKLNEMVAALG